MLSLQKAQKQAKLETSSRPQPGSQVQQLVSQLASMSPAKQNAVNQAAHLAMNSGQFQPIYYYTANPNAANGVQLGYPGVYPFQFYNFANPQFAHHQAQAVGPHGLLGAAPNAALKSSLKPSHSKGKLQANTSNTTSEGSDHGVHSTHTKSVSLHSQSDHGDQEIQNLTESAMRLPATHKPSVTFGEVEVSELTQMVMAPKAKKQKPAKPVKKVIAIDLPEELSTIDTVTNALSQHGEILSVRVIKPGKIMPFDLKMYSGKHTLIVTRKIKSPHELCPEKVKIAKLTMIFLFVEYLNVFEK